MNLPDGLPAAVFDETVALLVELAAISSPTNDPAGLRRCAERYAAALAGAGLPGRIEEHAGRDGAALPVLVAGAEGSGSLLLVGHVDTVLPAIPPRRDGERLFATGAIDMKGGLAVLVGALRLLALRGAPLPPELQVVVVPDEEIGGPICAAQMARFGATARETWVLEPGGRAEGGAETVVIGRRGLLHWRLDVRGRAAHAGTDYAQGRSALVAAADWCVRARALGGAPGDRRPGAPDAEGPLVNPARLVAGAAAFAADPAADRTLLGSARQLNVVPDAARVEGEARVLRAGEMAPLEAALAALAADVAHEHEVTADFTVAMRVPPLDPARNEALAARAIAAAAARGWTLAVERARGGISFPNFLPPASTAPALDGLGPIGGGMHTRDEHVLLPSLARRIVLLADLMSARDERWSGSRRTGAPPRG